MNYKKLSYVKYIIFISDNSLKNYINIFLKYVVLPDRLASVTDVLMVIGDDNVEQFNIGGMAIGLLWTGKTE